MPAILPSLNVESGDGKLSRYFLPHQMAWIRDEARMRLAEKSVRIGWTYADAMKNTRKRLLHKNRDYLFATKDQASAVEYMRTCLQMAEIFNFTRSIVARGEDSETVSGTLANGEKFTQEIRFNYLKFDNGSRIMAFSSNPYAMAVFGGDVGLDEFAKHANAEKLWETAQGRVTWGYDIGIWSAHDGTDTLFYQFAQEARSGKGGWSYYRVTMEDAVALGLVEKINSVRGTKTTREEFMADCKLRARLPKAVREEVNRRMGNGEKGRALAAWLNSLPEAQAVMAEEFEGRPIREQNLSEWRKHGYKEWLWRQEALKMAAEAGNLQAAGAPPLTEQMAAWASVRYLLAVRKLVEKKAGGEPILKVLHEFCHDIVALRRGECSEARLKFDQERLELEREKMKRLIKRG